MTISFTGIGPKIGSINQDKEGGNPHVNMGNCILCNRYPSSHFRIHRHCRGRDGNSEDTLFHIPRGLHRYAHNGVDAAQATAGLTKKGGCRFQMTGQPRSLPGSNRLALTGRMRA